MRFIVLPNGQRIPHDAEEVCFLLTDNWDDWFRFSTLYVLVYCDEFGEHHHVGGVKIGQFEMAAEQRRADIPEEFEVLGDQFFSLGQDEDYYEALNAIGVDVRDDILASLRDVAIDSELFDRALAEDVTGVSLLRSVTKSSIRGQFARLARGGARLSRYEFSYSAPKWGARSPEPVTLEFEVEPESTPPTNIHVLIGRNAVGKTFLLNHMTRALVEQKAAAQDVGEFDYDEEEFEYGLFSNIVSVTFSAFDDFMPLQESRNKASGARYSYIGLKRKRKSRTSKVVSSGAKSPAALNKEFGISAKVCCQGARLARWRRALEMLETDPIFQAAEVASLADLHDLDDILDEDGDEVFRSRASKLFKNLSSGHKIVLLTITRLVETVAERTLVLLDEPEAHLHPPLLSAFVRALSDLLVDRNGVAIVATHSPVVLQEVPRNCVWKVRRAGKEVNAERPAIETFGENVGVLTREVFGLEVTHSGFHRLLRESVEQFDDYDDVLDHFEGELGAEGKAIARSLLIADE